MIPLSDFRELVDYNYWARDRQLQACATLTPEQFVQPLGSSFASVRDTLAHLLLVEWIWLERWQGRSPRTVPLYDQFPTLATIEARWRAVEGDLRSYLAGLREEALARLLTYTNIKGEAWTYPLGKIVQHLFNHQSYHRGQVTTLLRQLGATPAAVDFLIFLDSRQ